MAFLGKTYNRVDEAPANQFDPLPSGDYPAMVVESDMKETNAKNGHYLELEFDVIDGPHKGRKVWARLNLDNPNPKAVQIAEREFAALRFACNVGEINDSSVLHNRPLIIRVEFVPAKPGKRDRAGNEVRDFKRIDGSVQVATGAPAANSGAPAPGAAPASFPGAQTNGAGPVSPPGWAKPQGAAAPPT